jgi:seryl-tRNA synthetase
VLDLKRLRNDTDAVIDALARRSDEPTIVERVRRVLELDAEHRKLIGERDDARRQIAVISKEVGLLRRDGKLDEAEAKQAESRALGDAEKAIDGDVDRLADEIRDLLLRIPNTPAADVPDGVNEDDNVELRVVGDPDAFAEHQRVPHWDIGAELGILDFERAVKISGSMFAMYRGWGARLLRAMIQCALDRNADLYEEVRPPTLVLTDTMISTGHLPKFDDDAYHIERDDLWAIPTAEVPLTSLHRDEILDEATLPRRYTAHTSCFRREAGSAGRDTRGLLRVHEFDKVELLAVAANEEQARAAEADILERAERLTRDLGLTYRVVDRCVGDLGSSAAHGWDIEGYAPGCGLWLELSSVSWFSDYQARRANVRYRPTGGKGTEICHTVNGSAMGWARTVAAYLETHRQPDGAIGIVDALRPYLGGHERIPPAAEPTMA